MARFSGKVALLCVVLLTSFHTSAYSVLTHEELIDLAWNDSIRPLLLAKFPGATDARLAEAHAFAYGGSAIQDMGYYPFGKEFFSDLTHYARTGDFIEWMFRNAKTIDEYAFAIGAFSHYLGDTIGHSQAVNPATAIEFPRLERRFGRSVTYDESPHGHIRTEFAFDVGELSTMEFASPEYLEHIGFLVPRKFLENAFIATYGFDIHEVLGRAHPALRSYRTSVRWFIPAFGEAEVVLHHKQFPAPTDDEASRVFRERVEQTDYQRNWKHTNHGPGIKAHLLAVVVWIVPKVGPISDLAIKIPNTQTEDWYRRSVNHTLDAFRAKLQQLREHPEQLDGFANLDLDTGERVKLGDYPLADQTYAHLLARLTSDPQRVIPEGVQRNLLRFYGKATSVTELPQQIPNQLTILKSMKTTRNLPENDDPGDDD